MKISNYTVYYFLVGFLMLCGVFIPGNIAQASPIIRSADTVTVEQDQILENDFYGMGRAINISGVAKEDVFVAGGSVTTNNTIEKDLNIVAGTVQIHGKVGDDVRVVGGEVTLAEPVEGDVLVVGGILTILSSASVSGDVIFAGGELNVDGTVLGSIMGTASTVRINSKIGGDIALRASESFTLGDKADVEGDIEYKSPQDMTRAQNAMVAGKVSKTLVPPSTSKSVVRELILLLFVILFAALTVFYILRNSLESIAQETASAFGKRGLIGLAMFITIPFVGMLLFASVLGSLVGILLMMSYVLLLFVAFIVSGIVFGAFLSMLITKKKVITLMSSIIGTVIFCLLPAIPIIGTVIMVAVWIVVFGALCVHIYRLMR